MSNKIKISIISGENQGKDFELDLFTSLLVGRSRKSAIRLSDADVSGRHFEFVRSTSGCCVKDLSRNGLKIDGHVVGEGEIAPVRVGSVIEVGAEAKLRVDELPDVAVEDGAEEKTTFAGTSKGEDTATGTDFFEADVDNTTSVVTAASVQNEEPQKDADGMTSDLDEARTRGDFDEALTDAGEDGETQEMKTRVGSMEEIYARKRQLDRASVVRRWRFGAAIAAVFIALGGVWIATGSRRHVSDAEGPFLPNGEPDVAEWEVHNNIGDLLFVLEYPRDDHMKVTVSDDSNTVDVVSFLGVDRDVPFHLEFKRWSDVSDLRYSLEDSFERRLRSDSEGGISFEVNGDGKRPEGEFFDSVFPGYCEEKSQHGVRFVRTQFTRSVKNELWHGVSLYLRNGDMIYQLRTEIPDMYWKRGGYRLTDEPHLAVFKVFSERQWDSPGRSGIVSDKFSDDFLLSTVKRELAAERVSAWPTVATYIDTLLVHTWDSKPVMQKLAMAQYADFLERLRRFYNERRLAFETARANGDAKRMRMVFTDAKTVFGTMVRDRRSTLVNDPEQWACQQSR